MQPIGCLKYCSRQRQTEFVLEDQPDHAERRAAERERVLRARGFLADREEANQAVNLVVQRQRYADRLFRAGVIWTPRCVMLGDGRGRVGETCGVD